MLAGCSCKTTESKVLPWHIVSTWSGGLNGAAMTSQTWPGSPCMQQNHDSSQAIIYCCCNQACLHNKMTAASLAQQSISLCSIHSMALRGRQADA